MIYIYNGVKVYYEFHNNSNKIPIILLHGWGRSGEDFKDFISLFPDRQFLTVDFPPFGKSQKEFEDWNIFTYVSMLMSLCEHLSIDKADFIGHSFGGRIAIILSAVKRSLVHSCMLVDSAGMKPKRTIKYRVKVLRYKLNKKLGKNVDNFGSSDYLALPDNLKGTFKSIVNTHLEDYAKKMSVKTLIVWGDKDDQTPMYMAKRLHRLIKNSKLEILEGAGHFSFLDCPLEFFSIVYQFLST